MYGTDKNAQDTRLQVSRLFLHDDSCVLSRVWCSLYFVMWIIMVYMVLDNPRLRS